MVPKSKVEEATKIAIDAGFRHIDAAYVYGNEEEVGQAIQSKIADGTVKREDIFYTSKLWVTFFRPELVQTALETSLKKLQLDYVDLYIIHLPVALKPGKALWPQNEHGNCIFDTVDLLATWEALEKCKDAGLTKSIGVSNFNRRQLELILNKPGLKYKPVCNQVECHPYLNQRKLLDFCKSKDIVLVAYSALGSQREKRWVDQNSPVLLDDPVLCDLAKKHKRTPALIALRYQIQRGVVVLAKSFNEKRIKENMQVMSRLWVSGGLNIIPIRVLLCKHLNTTLDHVNFPNISYAHMSHVHSNSFLILLQHQKMNSWMEKGLGKCSILGSNLSLILSVTLVK
ncbi:aldo-keto reductase family 1 member C23-like protein isoform X3 [Tamandua tetradactyla]|uniref:aldo-keto reductase family 1 member C23-like protein isoform X3 n=1 Tax=Tamandua tetradactyla TaxID=48850 RepID=UPI00405457C9